MNIELKKMWDKLNQDKGKRNLLIAQLKQAENDATEYETLYENCLKARLITQNVAEETQKSIEYHISNLVSMALASVFPDPYTFSLRFVQRRNKTEADLIFSKNGNETDDILNAGGGGIADVASFALRIALWSLKKTRACFLLDEPGKFISRELQSKFSSLLKEISSKLSVQIIMVSHIPELCSMADRKFICTNKNGVADVSED